MNTTAAPRRARSEKRQRTRMVAARLTPAEHLEVTRRADRLGVPISALVRSGLFSDTPDSRLEEPHGA